MRHSRLFVSIGLSLNLLTATATAGPFSELIVFGDTLSDNGNAEQFTFGLQPGPFYFEGRFTNGPVYAELLATELGLSPLTPSALGGRNFAFGAAQTSGTGGLAGAIIEDIDEQVDEFLMGGPADPQALFVMLAGSNDFLNQQTDVSVPVNNLVADLQRLIDAEARTLLVLNLPLLGLSPRFNSDPVQAVAMNELTLQFNSALAAALDVLAASAPTTTILRFDVAELIEQVVMDPSSFGMTNVIDPAAPGLSPGDTTYDISQIVDNPNSYLFWDDLHPTAGAHAILAERVAAAVMPVPEPAGMALITGLSVLGLLRLGRRLWPRATNISGLGSSARSHVVRY